MAAIPGDAVDGVRVRKEILLSPGTEVFNLVGDVHLPVCTSCLKKVINKVSYIYALYWTLY